MISDGGWRMAERSSGRRTETSTGALRFLFRFSSTLVLWSIALGIIFFRIRARVFCLDRTLGLLSLWSFYGILDHKACRISGDGDDLRHRDVVRELLYFSGSVPAIPTTSNGVAAVFLSAHGFSRDRCSSGLRDDAPLADDWLHDLWAAYVLWLYNFITKIVYVVPRSPTGAVTGQFYVLYLIAITKFSDMGAYLTGSLIGRHQLIPHISPKKTWEGFFGALAFSLLASWGMFWLMPVHLSVLNWTHATVLGLLLGFAAVIGDLAESIVKRSTGVKDSGNFLPGIGGALDLIDSLLFTAPLLFSISGS